MTFSNNQIFQRTKSVLTWTRLLDGPFWGVVAILSMILFKNMGATPLQIACFVAIKPISGLFAIYWSQMIHRRRDYCKKNLIIAHLLRYFPFLFIPWIHSVWAIIGIFGWYMALHRGVIPAWMEIIKVNFPPSRQLFLVGHGTVLDHLLGAISPILLGITLDYYEEAWRWIFSSAALCGMISTIFLFRLPNVTIEEASLEVPSSDNVIVNPWKGYFSLLKKRPDFLNFQIGFMLGGAGLMVIQPALPGFFVRVLHLSYTELSIATTVCKGIGFILTTPFWINLFRQINIYAFSAVVAVIASIFPFFLFAAQIHIVFLYLAFVLYGIMQGGSDLSWRMSSSVFAKTSSSTVFSEANVLSVGMRGSIIPLVGALLSSYFNSFIIMMLGSFFSGFAAYYFIQYHFSMRRVSKY